MNVFEFTQNLRQEVFCRLGASKIHGVGVFAIRKIPKGTNPMKETRETDFLTITKEEVDSLPKELRRLVVDMCPETDGLFDVPNYSLNEIGVSYYLNHSASPNMATDDGGDFYALCDIEVGEELTVNYGTYGELNLK